MRGTYTIDGITVHVRNPDGVDLVLENGDEQFMITAKTLAKILLLLIDEEWIIR